MLYRKKTPMVYARQLNGDSGNYMAVANWIAENGLPWLLGDATKAETLAPAGGVPGDPGIYIAPATGVLVLKTSRHVKMVADHSDWIVKDLETGNFLVLKPPAFEALYEPVTVPQNAPRVVTNAQLHSINVIAEPLPNHGPIVVSE